MKKLILFLLCLAAFTVFTPSVRSEIYQFETNVNMNNFWEKTGKPEHKVLSVGSHIIEANKLSKRVPIFLERTKKINAFSNLYTKEVGIYYGLLYYIDNDDELAFVLSHEIAHSLDAHDGYFKWLAMRFNSKSYEYKADLIAIDLMVKAGYDPIAAITISNKIFDEPQSDWGIWKTHPLGSKRLMNIYQYISKKYPESFSSDMTKSVYYKNFTYSAQNEIRAFKQKEKEKALKRKVTL